ncbi:alpha-N-acetylgalactosaminide alpha-2,6-sialyltransferase 1-like [Patiria miniata]|uniref:alpha-N-acetylgalactosaminide alpha-2,6-sialyltransferase n=1 Tax=Patiria miniata TaxID=46514 RepID=A0A914BU74_PATMI|nr:alpha-N-acetylgalactosaminide alpha-2,6-sialyltransferase 1-like [Patiria miniata]
MAVNKSRARLQSTMVNVLFCYAAFTVTGVVTWVHLHTQTVRQQVPQHSLLPKLSDFKPDPGILDQDLPLENSLEKAGNQTENSLEKAGNQTEILKPANRQEHQQKQQVIEQQQKQENRHETEQTNKAKCTKTIASLAKYSKWFRDRFKPKTKLFMDKNDLKDLRRLSTRILPNGLRGQKQITMNDILLHKNFTNPPVHGPSKKPGCVSCAVVGSGGILNGSLAGQEIDSHDYVFRVNQAHSSGRFAEDVGHRTTFYTFYPESQNISKQGDDVIAFYAMFKSYDVQYALRILNGENYTNGVSKILKNGTKSSDIDPKRLKLIHPGFFLYITNEFLAKKFRPTTGALNVFIALHICDDVRVYGFGYDLRYSLHYYDKEFIKHRDALTVPHNIEMEKKLWLKLHDEGAIKLFKRDL